MDRLCSHLGYEEYQSRYQVEDEGIAAVVKAIAASRNKNSILGSTLSNHFITWRKLIFPGRLGSTLR